ncbi:MAG: hypothetical protein WBK54_05765 [Bacilli bacterium]|jgi:uncharacterized membrane protein HdeD (DUF308 family)|nr:hypothetical protein [Acholeplasmataceae bacterium]
MKNFFKKYLWLFEFIGVAIILAVGFFAFFKKEVFLYIAGFALIIMGLLRVIPLVKTTKDNVLKIIYSAEIFLNVLAGILLILEGGKGDDYKPDLMRYLVGGVLYLRGAIYYYATVLRKEATDYLEFFVHLALLTLGVIIFVTKFFTVDNLAWVVLILAILAALFIGYSGYRNYRNYRYERLATEETKKIKHAPAEEGYVDPEPLKDDVIIPEEEEREELNV